MADLFPLPLLTMRRFGVIGLCLGLALLLPTSAALAQSANPLINAATGQGSSGNTATPAATPDQIGDLIKALDDSEARAKLKQQLQLLLEAQRGAAQGKPATEATPAEQGIGAHLLATVSHYVESVSNALVNLITAIADMPQRLRAASQALADPVLRDYWINVVVDLLGVLATAFVAAWAARRLLARPRHLLAQRQPIHWTTKLLYLPLIFVVDVAPAVAFAAASSIVFPLFNPNASARLIISAIIGAQLVTMLTTATTQALLAPRAPGLRLFHLTDETAAYLQVWVRRLAVVAFYGYAVGELASVIGVDPALYELFTRAWGLLLAAMTGILVLQNRVPVARRIAGGEMPAPVLAPQDEPLATPLPEPEPETRESRRQLRFRRFRGQLARFWHILAILYVIASYAVWSFQIEGGFAFLFRATVLTGILFVVIRLADTFLRQAFDRSFALPEDVKRLLPGLEARANRYLPILKQALLMALYLAAFFALLQVWGLDVIGWLSQGSGRPMMAAFIKIVIIVALSAALSEFVNLAIEHSLREHDQYGRRIYHSARMRTLLPLLRNAFRITLGVILLLVILSEIGLDIGPLLAAAGVVGLAVGFGAQTLVKDIITGIFILLEDTIAIGDVVDFGGHAGVVEGMTIRTIRLRDGSGTVHTVPFSSVTIVQNLTKDFSYATFDIKVDYRENADQVIEAMKEIGTEIAKDPQFRFGVLGPIEIIGLDAFLDTGMVVKARMKTRAMSQWDVMRAFNLRLKRLFDRRGIRFPGMMAANPVPSPAPAEAPKDQPAPAPLAEPAAAIPAARPEGQTIVPPR
ncbi:MAG TPA: mechanosensitive ion channel domain-containing protein [Candidatus Cybelea sp.]|nr:mechanosensitive ion channel domain-containing protein [Candidatus Cybelea sp.]